MTLIKKKATCNGRYSEVPLKVTCNGRYSEVPLKVTCNGRYSEVPLKGPNSGPTKTVLIVKPIYKGIMYLVPETGGLNSGRVLILSGLNCGALLKYILSNVYTP